jgi:hypothetical protein
VEAGFIVVASTAVGSVAVVGLAVDTAAAVGLGGADGKAAVGLGVVDGIAEAAIVAGVGDPAGFGATAFGLLR